MIEIIWKPELHSFNSCQEFADEFRLCETDLILTNEYIYQPYFGSMNLGCRVLYQEKYGIGEPTDTMTEAIMQDMKKTDDELERVKSDFVSLLKELTSPNPDIISSLNDMIGKLEG